MLPHRGLLLAAMSIALVAVTTARAHAQTPYAVNVWNFTTATDGAFATGSLVQADDGDFYGTTLQGGPAGAGTVFRLDASGTFTTLHAFSANGLDGAYPSGGLIQASDHKLYGTTQQGGGAGQGTVYRIDRSGTFTILHAFNGATEGAYPQAGIIEAIDGNFYGTTYNGGANGAGTVFKMNGSGTLTTLHTFDSSWFDGGYPASAVVQGQDGNFYGTTEQGGAAGIGVIFKMDSAGNVTLLHSFDQSTSGG